MLRWRDDEKAKDLRAWGIVSAWARIKNGKQASIEEFMPFSAPLPDSTDAGWNALMEYMGGEDIPEESDGLEG